MSTIYDFTVKTIDGGEKSLADYRGEVLLVVNTATRCGFTPQLEGLEALQRAYHGRGFEVLVNREGQVVARFAPTTTPAKIEASVKALL